MRAREVARGASGAIRWPHLKVGKVMGVHRAEHAVDLTLLDGTPATRVPVLTGWGGTTFGLVGLVAGTFDRDRLARKVYPLAEPPPAGAIATSPVSAQGEARDIYAVAAQLESSHTAGHGLVVLGFLYPAVSEMLFPPGDSQEAVGSEDYDPVRFVEMLLLRHPSDVQIVLDRWGRLTVQHPAGGRFALDSRALSDAPPPPDDLQGKDADGRYRLRANVVEAIPLTGRYPEAYLGFPVWRIDEFQVEELGTFTVTDRIPPSPAVFATTIPASPEAGVGLILAWRGHRTRIVAQAADVTIVGPPLPEAPQVGDVVTVTRYPLYEGGAVFLHLQNGGDARWEAFWRERLEEGESVIRGRLFQRAGVLHDTLVEAGTIRRVAHPSEDTLGDIRDRADLEQEAAAGTVNVMHNDAGAKVQLLEDGTIHIDSPTDIHMTAAGQMYLRAAIIHENDGGSSGGDEGQSQGPGQAFGRLGPMSMGGGSDSGPLGGMGGGGGIKLPGMGGSGHGGGGGIKLPAFF